MPIISAMFRKRCIWHCLKDGQDHSLETPDTRLATHRHKVLKGEISIKAPEPPRERDWGTPRNIMCACKAGPFRAAGYGKHRARCTIPGSPIIGSTPAIPKPAAPLQPKSVFEARPKAAASPIHPMSTKALEDRMIKVELAMTEVRAMARRAVEKIDGVVNQFLAFKDDVKLNVDIVLSDMQKLKSGFEDYLDLKTQIEPTAPVWKEEPVAAVPWRAQSKLIKLHN